MSSARQIASWVNFVTAAAVVLGVFLQVYFIASYASGAEDALSAHKDVGGVVHLIEVVVFLAAIVAFWGAWREIGLNFSLPLIGTIQLALAPSTDGDPGNGWVHGFHGLLALFVLIIAAVIAHRGMRALGLRQRTAA